MNTAQFYLRALSLPPIVLGLSLLLPEDTKALITLQGVGFWGLLYGGIPYCFLVWWLVRYSKTHPLPSLERALRWSPLLFLPLVALWTSLLVIADDTLNASGHWTEILSTLPAFVIIVCVYAVVVGYISVGSVFLMRQVLQHFGVIERA